MNLVEKAFAFALKAHEGQRRKDSTIPYIFHPAEVATICGTVTEDEDILAAALLHDTVEDCDVDALEIRREFGPRVYALVMSETEDKRPGKSPEETWMERKEETLLYLETSPDIGVKILWLGDKLANIRSFYRLKKKKGDAMWQIFHQKDPKMHEWYYRSVVSALEKDLGDTPAFQEFKQIVNLTFEGE